MTTERERAFATWANCEPGESDPTLDDFRRAWNAAWQAALAQPAQPVAWATPSLLVTLSAVEKNHLTNPDRRKRGVEFESAARDAERYSVPLYAALAQPAQPSPLSASELSDAECDAIAREMLDRCDVPADREELFIVNLLDTRALIRAGRATVAEDAARWQIVGELVDRQAEDEGLWFVARTAPEDYLQLALREIHAAIDAARGKP